jgi:hypothetical protein
MAKPEQVLQLQICEYLRMQYPKVIFFSEPSGLRVSIGQAVLLKKMRSYGKLPDMFIAHPNEKYHGFFLELKKEGTTIFKKDGELVADPHIRAQFKTLLTLYELGYAATFGIGFEHAKKKIDNYLKMEKSAPEMDFTEKEK